MVWWRRKREAAALPREPGPVFVELADGSRVGPVPLLYIGQDDEGIHVWQGIVAVEDGLVEMERMTCATLPARTAVHLI